MKDVAFCTDSFASPKTIAYSERTLACLLWALVFANESYLLGKVENDKARVWETGVPLLYQSGIYWRREEPTGKSACPGGNGQEQFLGIRQVIEQGYADCEDVCAWRVAELRLGLASPRTRGLPPNAGHPMATVIPAPFPMRARGVDALPAFFSRQTGPSTWTYHIVVFWPDGTFEDPSRVLGMGGANRYG